jgi:hypothetical protein
VRIVDEADEEDVEIHGVIELDPDDKILACTKTELLEIKAIVELRKHYQDLMKEFPGLKISLDETNFKKGRIWYSLTMSGDDIVAVNAWKKDQGVGLIPTPEDRVGADIT